MFTVSGYDVVTVREIAEAVGISQPTLYRYIGSKQELLATIYESMQGENLERFAAVAESDASPDEKHPDAVSAGIPTAVGARD